jgi:two-component system, sensor histidine kinase and response regulator
MTRDLPDGVRPPSSATLSGVTDAALLVVEDETSLHPLYERVAALAGATADLAASGVAALRLAELRCYACALVDKNLPDANGIEIAEAIKRQSPTTEVLVVTGYPNTDSAIACLKLGGFDYVIKPFGVQEMAGRVRAALERRRWQEGQRRDARTLARRLAQVEAEIDQRLAAAERVERVAHLTALAGGLGAELDAIAGLVTCAAADSADAARRDLEAAATRLRGHAGKLARLGRPGSDHEPAYDARVVVAQVLELLRAAGRTRWLEELRAELPATPVWVTVARGRLEEMIVHLVANAADADETRNVVVTLACDAVAGRVTCRVEDDGPGIAPQLRERVFEPYVTTHSERQAIGWGLPAVRALVERYGGTLRLECGEMGTRASFDLPGATV